MSKGDNHKMMDPRMGQIAMQNAVMPGGPQNNNPMNVTSNSDNQRVKAQSIYKDFEQDYPQMGTGVVNPEGVRPSDLLTNVGQRAVVGQKNNASTPFNMQQQPDASGNSPFTDQMESSRLAQYAMQRGLPPSAMGLTGMPAIPGGMPGDMPGTSGPQLMPGMPGEAGMIPGSTPQKVNQKKKRGNK